MGAADASGVGGGGGGGSGGAGLVPGGPRPDAAPAVAPPAGVVAAGVRWFGRVDTTDPTKPRFSWSGSGFAAQFSGTSLTMQLDGLGPGADLQDGRRRRAAAAVHRHAGAGDVPAGDGPHRRHAHRGALPADGRPAGRVAAHGTHRRRRHADGPARRRRSPHRDGWRLDHVWLRNPRHAVGHRVLHHPEPLGHLRGRHGPRARRRGQHHRRLRPRHHPQLRRRHRKHDAGALHARAVQHESVVVGLPRRAAGGRHQPGDQRHQQQQGRSRRRLSRHVPDAAADHPRLLPAARTSSA